jgi:hypothetical protein
MAPSASGVRVGPSFRGKAPGLWPSQARLGLVTRHMFEAERLTIRINGESVVEADICSGNPVPGGWGSVFSVDGSVVAECCGCEREATKNGMRSDRGEKGLSAEHFGARSRDRHQQSERHRLAKLENSNVTIRRVREPPLAP